MNVIIEGLFRNGVTKEMKNKKTGEITPYYVCHIEQEIKLENGEIDYEPYKIPVDIKLADQYKQKKKGDLVKVPCNIYGENFANIKISMAK